MNNISESVKKTMDGALNKVDELEKSGTITKEQAELMRNDIQERLAQAAIAEMFRG